MTAAPPPVPDSDALYELAPCGQLVTTEGGAILRVNRTLCQWLGYSREEFLSRGLQDLLSMGGKVFYQTHLGPLMLMQGSVSEVKLDVLHRDGHTIPMIMNVIRTADEMGRLHVISLIVATDRSRYEAELLRARKAAEKAAADRKEAELELGRLNKALAETNRKKDEFLATLAHELRNPLAPMRNVLEILRLRATDDPKVIWGREVLTRQLHQMTHLVDDLLEVSRITQGKLELQRKTMDLADAMRGAVESAKPLADKNDQVIHVDYPSPPIHLFADPVRLTQVLQNLVNNAGKYTPRGGQIFLSAERREDVAVVRVRDTGIGIPPEQLTHIFEMFSQLTPALERAQGGLGIGLALVRGMVELHGGNVSATSAGIGRGSEFTIEIPIRESDIPDTKPEPDMSASQNSITRVLVVDDNTDSADSLAEFLRILGSDVRTAYDGLKGLDTARTFLPQVVLLDIGLPNVNGYEIARRLRNEAWGRNVLLIAVSGWGQAEDKKRAMESGFNHHMTKPINPMDILSLLPSGDVRVK